MVNIQPSNWIKITIFIVSLQVLGSSMVLPYIISSNTISYSTDNKNSRLLTETLEDLFHIPDNYNDENDSIPVDSDENNLDKDLKIDAIEITKKDPVYPNLKELQIIPLDNTAASLYQPELHTPPPKQA